jgi:hypothetical protein
MESSNKESPVVVAKPSPIPLNKKGTLTLTGTGFKPGQKLTALFQAKDGVTSDIGYALKPEPVTDETGSWSTVWSYGRFVSKKLIQKGTYTLTVTDASLKTITTIKLEFQ